MSFKVIPAEKKQSFQIGIPEKLAIFFVALLLPASDLAGLV